MVHPSRDLVSGGNVGGEGGLCSWVRERPATSLSSSERLRSLRLQCLQEPGELREVLHRLPVGHKVSSR